MTRTGQWTALALLACRVPGARCVFGGSYVDASDFATSSPFRGAVQSGGGTGIVLFRDGDEAVVLTVAHGYDLTSLSAQEQMDNKLNNDGGLRQAYAQTAELSGARYATSSGSSNIIAENLHLFRYFSFGDTEACPSTNGGNHAGTLDDPYGCDGVWPDIDVAMQHIRLTAEAQTRTYPETGLHLEPIGEHVSPLFTLDGVHQVSRVGEHLQFVGFGRQASLMNELIHARSSSMPR